MADWSHPVLADSYTNVLTTYLNGRDVDAITLQKNASSNPPDGAFRYDRGTDKFQEYNLAGTAYVDKVLALVGGGTGAATASAARTNLGLGSMATQANNAVNITGGSITGVTVDASVITTGTIALARGGTGASLSLGANKSILQSNGTAVIFGTDGSGLTGLDTSQFATGLLAIARGGTNSGTASGARTNLGLGSMAVQDASNVAITGGVIDPAVLTSVSSSAVSLAAGGTGKSLTIGANHTFLGSDGSVVAFRPVPSGAIQTVQSIATTGYAVTSSFANVTFLNVAITPTSATSRVRIQCVITVLIQSTGGTFIELRCLITRGGTQVSSIFKGCASNFDGNQAFVTFPLEYIDSPASTSSLTYAVQAEVVGSVNSCIIGGTTVPCMITATEIQ